VVVPVDTERDALFRKLWGLASGRGQYRGKDAPDPRKIREGTQKQRSCSHETCHRAALGNSPSVRSYRAAPYLRCSTRVEAGVSAPKWLRDAGRSRTYWRRSLAERGAAFGRVCGVVDATRPSARAGRAKGRGNRKPSLSRWAQVI